ncbi:MAG: hypothetical protein AAF799_08080 [Myxococcota bacterium]
MAESQSHLRLFAPWAEAPLAYTCATLAFTTIIWKTVGLDFVPGWEEMFGVVGAQYPRRVEPMAPAWSIAYLIVYGFLGTASTAAGVLVTRRRGALSSPAGPQVSRYARIVGAFHTVIGIHHTLWALTAGAWGHLTLEQFDVPGLYLIGGIGGLGAGLHGLRLLRSSATTPTHRIVRSKIAVDGVSFLTFTSVFVCFPMNLLGLPRNLALEKVSWVAVFVQPALWLLLDLLYARSARAGRE